MKQKDVKQIVDEVIEERVTIGDVGRSIDGARIGQKIGGKTGATIGSNVGYYSRDVVTAGIVGYALKKLYDAYKKEKDPKKKAVLKSKINKAKAKVKAKKAVKESYNFTENEMVEIFGEGLGSTAFKIGVKAGRNIKKASIISGGAVGGAAIGTGIKKLADKAKSRQQSQVAVAGVGVGIAGALAYKLYKKLKDKYNKAKDPKEKAKLKKLVAKAKAKTKKK